MLNAKFSDDDFRKLIEFTSPVPVRITRAPKPAPLKALPWPQKGA